MTRRVHIVDDDELVRARISYLLSNHGFSTEIYTGGDELFDEGNLKQGCILLDLSMPHMSGYEVLEELAERACALPVVIFSAQGDLAAVVRAMKLGATDFIEKPATEEHLFQAIDRALDSFGSGRPARDVKIEAAARLDRLPRRRRQVLQALLDGLPNKGIAHRLSISSRTVEMHRAMLKRDLDVASLSGVVQFAIDAGMSPFPQGRALDAPTQRSDSPTSVGA
jgi:two-component system, LuxR family, response regulator FixJ